MPPRACGGRSTPSRQGGVPWPTMLWLRPLRARWSRPARSATRCPGSIAPLSGWPRRTSGESAGNRNLGLTRLLPRRPGSEPWCQALRQLSPAQRAAVVLHYEADLSVQEVAQRMGTSVGAVKVHLFRGRRRLRELLGAEEAGDA